MYTIQFTHEAVADLRSLRKHDAHLIIDKIESILSVAPTTETRNCKRLRPNQLAEWELRIGEFRVFYDVSAIEVTVNVVAIGRKRGNRLLIQGKEYDL